MSSALMLPFPEPGGNVQNGTTSDTERPHSSSPGHAEKRTASSSTEGFFQQPPPLLNPLEDDLALQSALSLYVPSPWYEQLYPELKAFGDKVLSKPILDLVADAEHNPPYLKTWDAWGQRKDELVTSEGWRRLSAIGQAEGMVSIGYENKYGPISRPYMFIKYLIWAPSGAWTTCPNLMTDGVAALMRKHLSNPKTDAKQKQVLQSAFDRLTSADPETAWTTGQWMTERQGGSDVSQTETLAEYAPQLNEQEASMVGTDGTALGAWRVNGFKWFSSATDSQMMVFLARTPNGISTLMAPMRRRHRDDRELANGERTELNGVQIQRLKNKLGTRALPTAELVLRDVRAHLVGAEGDGVREIATVLNIARVHNAMTATGLWGRGLGLVRAFARVRKVGLKPLWSKPAFMRMLANMHVEYRANVLFCTYVASLLGVVEQPQIEAFCQATGARNAGKDDGLPPQPSAEAVEAAETLFRLLASVLKGLTAKAAIAGLAECMEAMGGVGYLENDDVKYNVARLYRDANVCSIWEGTTDMMSHDVLRVVTGKRGEETLKAVDSYVEGTLGQFDTLRDERQAVQEMWKRWKADVQGRERGELELRSRELMKRLGDVVMGVLLVLDAGRSRDGVAGDVLQAWLESRGHGREGDWQKVVAREKRIVFGPDGPDPARAML